MQTHDANGMMQSLSSRWTFVQKWVFPLVWSGGFGLIILRMLLHPRTFVFNGVVGGATPASAVLFAGAWIVGTAMTVAFGWRMKRVRLDGGDLLVSNYLREIRVPLTNVRSVDKRYNNRFVTVIIDFIEPTSFGSRIAFLVVWVPFRGTPAKVAEELGQLVAVAKAARGPV